MKKKVLMGFLSSLAIVFLFAGCGGKEETPQEEEPGLVVQQPVQQEEEPTQQPQPEEEEETGFSVIRDREVVDGKMQSYLTGEWKDESVVTRRPIAVMIPNNSPAMPQYGITRASIIYEAPVEGRITRLMGIFEDFDDLDRIGPIRSSRDYFLYVALGYEAIYCNWGLARPYVEELINRSSVQNISAAVEGIYNPANEAYDRVSRPGYATEFTGYLTIDGLKKAVDRLEYDWEYDDAHVPPFTFVTEDAKAQDNYPDAEDASMVYPGGKSGNQGGYGAYNPYFEYHADEGVYYRYQNGKAQIDEIDSSQIKVANVVFQYCHGEVRDDHDYLAFGVHGEGDAIVFTGGKVIRGTWKRLDGDSSPAKFYDENDEEIIFNQGKTWICNIWKEYGEFVSYE